MNLRPLLCLATALTVSCAHTPKVAEVPQEDLSGLVLPLEGGPTLRWVVAGEVSGRRAEVDLDLAAPLSLVTTGCFTAPPETKTTVKLMQVSGDYISLPEVTLPATAIGGRRIKPRPAGLMEAAECKVVLGTDVLGRYAFHFSPVTWEVRIATPSKGPADPEALPLAKDPQTDRLLVAARIHPETGHELVANFILSTTTPRSLLSEAAALGARIETDRALIRRLKLPDSVLQPLLQVSTFSVKSVELAPALSVERITIDGTRQWAQPAAVGLLGLDVWGRFEAVVDVPGQSLTLRRPEVTGEARSPRCTAGAATTQEGCFALHATRADGGVRAAVTVWRELPVGGRIYLEPLDAEGKTARAPCRIGFNLPAGDSGQSISQVFPWPELEKAFPACGEALKEAHGANLLLFEEGADSQCSGHCAMAVHPRGRAMVCSCASAPGQGNPNTTERALDLFRRLRETALRQARPAEAEEEPEPQD